MQLLIFNEEYLVGACHQRASITSLPFVHTARRSYRLNDPVRPPDCGNAAGSPAAMPREAVQTLSFRGRRSRNKVSVGEPAEGSLPVFPPSTFAYCLSSRGVVCAALSSSRRGERRVAAGSRPPTPASARSWVRSRAAPLCASRASVARGVSACRRRNLHLLGAGVVAPPLCCDRVRAFFASPRSLTPEFCTSTQLLPMDILAPATMKNAAKCDT